MSTWISTLIGGLALAAFTALSGFVLYRQKNVAETSNTALTTAGKSVALWAKAQNAVELQQERLDAWEYWGKRVKSEWNVLRVKMSDQFGINIEPLPDPPSGHVDLAAIFATTEPRG